MVKRVCVEALIYFISCFKVVLTFILFHFFFIGDWEYSCVFVLSQRIRNAFKLHMICYTVTTSWMIVLLVTKFHIS